MHGELWKSLRVLVSAETVFSAVIRFSCSIPDTNKEISGVVSSNLIRFIYQRRSLLGAIRYFFVEFWGAFKFTLQDSETRPYTVQVDLIASREAFGDGVEDYELTHHEKL